jgi:hypothetical protein
LTTISPLVDPHCGNDFRCGLDSAQLRLGGAALDYGCGLLACKYLLFQGHCGSPDLDLAAFRTMIRQLDGHTPVKANDQGKAVATLDAAATRTGALSATIISAICPTADAPIKRLGKPAR